MENRTLAGRKIILGVSGGIAAYKSAMLVRLLKKAGAEVQVLMTPDATRFITPLTLGTLSEREVMIKVFPENKSGSWTKHIHLGMWADLFVIAPATAQTIAKIANGFCDSMLTATSLAARCPILVCPAMDHDMYIHPASQRNFKLLQEMNYHVMPAVHGELASGLIGEGRLPEPLDIVHKICGIIQPDQSLLGKKVLITAGPTQEPLDPVRYLTNPSTGTMGYALASEAQKMGATVVLVSGKTNLSPPAGVKCINIRTANEMHKAVQANKDADIVVMAAAVADYTPKVTATKKIKKKGDNLTIELKRTPDILATLGSEKQKNQILVGFAMETDNALENASGKLKRKNLDWIVLNNLREKGAGFGTGTNRVTMLSQHGAQIELPLLSKQAVAKQIWKNILNDCKAS